jgi:hypothetical protein
VNEPLSPPELDAVRHSVQRGTPLGDAARAEEGKPTWELENLDLPRDTDFIRIAEFLFFVERGLDPHVT